MTIIVEDGTIVANANSYVTELELTTYATSRGITLSGTPEQLLIVAMDFIEQQNFIGTKSTRDQSLQWPRESVWVDGYYYEPDEIPVELKTSQMTAAISVDQGNDPSAIIEPAVKREKVDVLEVEYQDGAGGSIDVALMRSLSKIIVNSSGFGNFTVSRG